MSEFVPESAPLKEIISIWSRRADSGPNRNNLFSTRQIRERYQNILVSFPKQFRNVCPFVFDITSKEGYMGPLAFMGENGLKLRPPFLIRVETTVFVILGDGTH